MEDEERLRLKWLTRSCARHTLFYVEVILVVSQGAGGNPAGRSVVRSSELYFCLVTF